MDMIQPKFPIWRPDRQIWYCLPRCGQAPLKRRTEAVTDAFLEAQRVGRAEIVAYEHI